MKYTMVLFLILLSLSGISQKLNPTDDEAILRITVTDFDYNPLQTELFLRSEGKEYSFETDAEGYAEFVIPVAAKYRISILNSFDYYDYEIPDAFGLDYSLPLQFTVDDSGEKYATENQALLIISVLNKPDDVSIHIFEKNSDKAIAEVTDEASINLPVSRDYEIKAAGINIKNSLMKVDSSPEHLIYSVLFFHDDKTAEVFDSENKAVFNVNYKNLYTEAPAPKERVSLESENTGKKYQSVTNNVGRALFIAPVNDTYYLNISQAKKVITTAVDDKQPSYIYNCLIQYPSTKEYLEQKRKDSILLTKRDSLYAVKAAHDKSLQLYEVNTAKEMLEDKIKGMDKKLKENPHYFEQQLNPVCAVLYRFRNKWKSKMIVTDVTGSMRPYINELLTWHFLKLMSGEDYDYVFFNDGDNKRTSDKVIGKTGGIYYTAGNTNDAVLEELFAAMQKGSGGDMAENDIEALLFAVRKKKAHSELILIADNPAPVKDIELLGELDIPVRVILCGSEYGINPQYLEIAYKTGGSVHTVEEDIMHFGEMYDGKTLIIGGQTYYYSKGRFFKDKE